MRRSDLNVPQSFGSDVVISDTASPAPSRLQSWRNGLSVTPAIGARITLGSTRWGPMRTAADSSGFASTFPARPYNARRFTGDLRTMMRIASRLAALAFLALPLASAAEFVALEPELKTKEFKEIADELEKVDLLGDFAKTLNEMVEVPVELGLRFAECGEENAYYDPDEKVVSVCYELLMSYYELLGEKFETEDELDEAVVGAFMFVFFHEIGHALVDVLELPVTGREEDAVDQLSTWLLITGEVEDAVVNGALVFEVSASKSDEVTHDEFADEHSLDDQRVYNILCWLYGSDT